MSDKKNLTKVLESIKEAFKKNKGKAISLGAAATIAATTTACVNEEQEKEVINNNTAVESELTEQQQRDLFREKIEEAVASLDKKKSSVKKEVTLENTKKEVTLNENKEEKVEKTEKAVENKTVTEKTAAVPAESKIVENLIGNQDKNDTVKKHEHVASSWQAVTSATGVDYEIGVCECGQIMRRAHSLVATINADGSITYTCENEGCNYSKTEVKEKPEIKEEVKKPSKNHNHNHNHGGGSSKPDKPNKPEEPDKPVTPGHEHTLATKNVYKNIEDGKHEVIEITYCTDSNCNFKEETVLGQEKCEENLKFDKTGEYLDCGKCNNSYFKGAHALDGGTVSPDETTITYKCLNEGCGYKEEKPYVPEGEKHHFGEPVITYENPEDGKHIVVTTLKCLDENCTLENKEKVTKSEPISCSDELVIKKDGEYSKCATCGNEYKKQDHVWSSETIQYGDIKYTCDNCGYTYTDEHDHEKSTYSVWASDDYTHYKKIYCSTCGKLVKETTPEPHSFTNPEDLTTYSCECGKTQTVDFPFPIFEETAVLDLGEITVEVPVDSPLLPDQAEEQPEIGQGGGSSSSDSSSETATTDSENENDGASEDVDNVEEQEPTQTPEEPAENPAENPGNDDQTEDLEVGNNEPTIQEPTESNPEIGEDLDDDYSEPSISEPSEPTEDNSQDYNVSESVETVSYGDITYEPAGRGVALVRKR